MLKNRIIFVFLDGFGLGAAFRSNPIFASRSAFLTEISDGPLVEGVSVLRSDIAVRGVDACLGIPGLPQSATGQTALFTGVNAAQAVGCHMPAFPDNRLKEIIDRHALLKQVVDAGLQATFANAYSPLYFQMVEEGKRIHSVTTLSVFAADLPFRMVEELLAGEAVYWDITRERFRYSAPVARISAREAGRHLSSVSSKMDLTVFECFLSDLIGHKPDSERAREFVLMIDEFLDEIVRTKPSDATLVVSSDHGNIEDLTSGTHTRNPVPLIAVGPAAEFFFDAVSITDVTPAVLRSLCRDD